MTDIYNSLGQSPSKKTKTPHQPSQRSRKYFLKPSIAWTRLPSPQGWVYGAFEKVFLASAHATIIASLYKWLDPFFLLLWSKVNREVNRTSINWQLWYIDYTRILVLRQAFKHTTWITLSLAGTTLSSPMSLICKAEKASRFLNN